MGRCRRQSVNPVQAPWAEERRDLGIAGQVREVVM